MKTSHLRAADFTRQPWRNGGGHTTQLAVHGEADRWTWRLSLAEVAASGPFSDFSGYDRTIVLVEGAGMDLAIDGNPPVRLTDPCRPVSFDGGARTGCTLVDGPVRDLNLMVDRSRARATLEVVDTHAFSGRRTHAEWTLVYALRGRTRVTLPGVDATIGPGELLRIDGSQDADVGLAGLDRGSRVALVQIHSLDR